MINQIIQRRLKVSVTERKKLSEEAKGKATVEFISFSN